MTPDKLPVMTQANYALVTGASMGLGKVFAQALAARKHNVVLVARSFEKLERLAEELRTIHGVLAEPLSADLSLTGAGEQLAQQLRERGLQVDLLVNNAGFGFQGQFWTLSPERQLEMMRLNNEAAVSLTFHLLSPMIEARRGGIINISSMAGMQPIPYASLYSATKAFLTTFSMALEREIGRYGIKVVTVCPGRLRPNLEEGSNEDRKKFPGGEQEPADVVAATLQMLDNGGGLLIPGFANKAANFAERFFPRRLVAKAIGKMSRP